MPQITTRYGTEIHYKDGGTGQPIVFMASNGSLKDRLALVGKPAEKLGSRQRPTDAVGAM